MAAIVDGTEDADDAEVVKAEFLSDGASDGGSDCGGGRDEKVVVSKHMIKFTKDKMK